MYFIKTPVWVKKLWDSYVWDIHTDEKVLYLTFDDGPHPLATTFVLDTLDRFHAKATFFCVGENVVKHPDVFKNITKRGHAAGNHTYNHFNGWKTRCAAYAQNVEKASQYIPSRLFRPPYGRITNKQSKLLMRKGFKIIMWDVLSGDFDQALAPENCLSNVTGKAGKGSIIVFHDSEKAYRNMSYALPKALEYFTNQGFRFHCLKEPETRRALSENPGPRF